MLVPIRIGTNMAAGNKQKNLSLSFDKKVVGEGCFTPFFWKWNLISLMRGKQ